MKSKLAIEMVKKFCPFKYSPMAQGNQPEFNHPVFQAAEWLDRRTMSEDDAIEHSRTQTTGDSAND